MNKLFVLGSFVFVLSTSCTKSNLFGNRLTLNVENNTSYYKSMKLVIDGSTADWIRLYLHFSPMQKKVLSGKSQRWMAREQFFVISTILRCTAGIIPTIAF